VLANDTTSVGSVGVIAHHVDVSGAQKAAGVTVTPITSAKFKDAGSPHRPLDEMGRAEILRSVEHTHKVFVSQLARNLGVSQAAIAKVAEGKVYHGSEAIKAGLAHGFTGEKAQRGQPVPLQPHTAQTDVAALARKHIVEQEKLGKRVSAAEAVAFVTSSI
jgi:ClpP class serine protease